MDVLFKENNIFYNILCFLITENEKLFDRSDAKLYWRTVFHLLILYHHSFVGLFAINLGHELKDSPDSDLRMLYTFRMAYLTGWNVLFQTWFLFLAFAHDVLEWASKQDSPIASKIRFWRDVVFSGLVVPYTCFVFTMFWTIYAIDRELVFPAVYDTVIPWWFNQCVHSNIMVLLVVETLLQPRREPAHHSLELSINAAVGILYAVVYYCIYFFAGRWLYNVFGIMTWWQVCLFQLLIWFSSYVFYELQFPINRLIHGPVPEPQKEIEDVPEPTLQNVETDDTDGKKEKSNEEANKNGEVGKNAEVAKNGEVAKNRLHNSNVDLQAPPFSSKSWSLKYRNLRNQFEKTKL